jgi:Protein of unknown function (DUF2490)
VRGRTLVVTLLATGVALVRNATLHAQTDTEFWPELDVWIRINESLRVLLEAAGTRDRDTGERVESERDVYLDYRLNDQISLRTGYVYDVTPPLGEQERGVDRRFVLDFNYRWVPYPDMAVTSRTRVDLGDDQGTKYRRLQDRVRLEYKTHIWAHELTPYGDIEGFYDSRYNAISRWRLELGTSTPLGKCAELDIYLARQRDSGSTLQYTNAIGLTLSVFL